MSLMTARNVEFGFSMANQIDHQATSSYFVQFQRLTITDALPHVMSAFQERATRSGSSAIHHFSPIDRRGIALPLKLADRQEYMIHIRIIYGDGCGSGEHR
jgi:hypothetical protein